MIAKCKERTGYTFRNNFFVVVVVVVDCSGERVFRRASAYLFPVLTIVESVIKLSLTRGFIEFLN